MARCIDGNKKCKFYITAEETGDRPGCFDDGDIDNPTLDIYCAVIDGFDGDMDAWEKSKRATLSKNQSGLRRE